MGKFSFLNSWEILIFEGEIKCPYFKGKRLIFDEGKCLDLYISEKYLIEV